MRRLPFLVCALTLLVAPGVAPAAAPGTGGTAAPSSAGGLTYGQPVQEVRPASRRSSSRPVATRFAVAPAALDAGAPATFTYRVDGPMRRVRVRIELTRVGAAERIARVRLGPRLTGVLHTSVWTPAPGALPAGEYAVTLVAFDKKGRTLRRTAKASGRGHLSVQVAAPPPAPVSAGRFPVAGAYSLGGADARFGAARDGHVHEGQDITAAAGTPVIAPVAGTVYWIDFQRAGAGHYVVLRAPDGVDYVFMHLVAGSITTVKGAAIPAGQAFAQVGSTGASSGPHLHFEIWPDGWYSSKASRPIDPLPQLQAWAGAR
jgi:murein DD-endopeptidase MepM/ murein hydrolase activator NlpD